MLLFWYREKDLTGNDSFRKKNLQNRFFLAEIFVCVCGANVDVCVAFWHAIQAKSFTEWCQ